MTDKPTKQPEQPKKDGVDSDKIVVDDSGRTDLTGEELDQISGGLANRGGICRIQTDPRGCGMSM